MSDYQSGPEKGFDALLKEMKLADAESQNCYVYTFYDPVGDKFIYIGRSDASYNAGRVREKGHLTTSKKQKDYKQGIQDLLASTGIKICRPFAGLKHFTAQNYEAAMLLAEGGDLNQIGGSFRGSFLKLTWAERLAFGKHLVEKAKQFCRDDSVPIYTNVNIDSFKPSYVPLVSFCKDCGLEKELKYGNICSTCSSKKLPPIRARKKDFCKAGPDCPGLGLINKVPLKSTSAQLCDTCNGRIREQKKNPPKNGKRARPEDPKFMSATGDLETFPFDGAIVECAYILFDSNRKRLASSYYHTKNLEFVVGQDAVLPGLEDGVLKMSLGEKKEFIVESDRAFGPDGFTDLIPADSDLIFQVHLINIEAPKNEETDLDRLKKKIKKNRDPKYKFCKGVGDCPGLGLVKKILITSIPAQLCASCVSRKSKQLKALNNPSKSKKKKRAKRKVNDPKFMSATGDLENFPVDGVTVQCSYILLNSDRQRLASSYYHNKVLEFVIGQQEVLPGLEDGILKMSLGEKKEFIVESDRAFGPDGFTDLIPADSDLIFQVHLINIEAPKNEEADGDDEEAHGYETADMEL